jgi:Ca-activated chloride channel family protein
LPTAVAPRYLGAPGRVLDATRVTQEVASEPIAARLSLALSITDELAPGRAPESPSHALNAASPLDIRFRAEDGVPLDRDVVVRWAVATAAVGSLIEVARAPEGARTGHAAYGLLTLVPPRTGGAQVGRDVVVLLDTSGSMSGEPLAQACRVLSAVVDTLGSGDVLEMIQFSSAPRRWKREPVAVTPAIKRAALSWLASRTASGGTEMRDAIVEALCPLRQEAQRQVILVTDGFIGFEAEVVGAIATRGSRATRVHAVGVGSSVNRSLTSAAARAGGGVEVILGLGEDAEPAAQRIVARTHAPLVVDLEIGGSAFVAHAGLPDLFAGTPALIPLTLHAEGGELWLRGRSAEGLWEQRMTVAAAPSGSGRAEVVGLFGRERVEDLEARVAAGEGGIDAEIERVGLDFGISTRLSSWVAVSETPSVDPQSAVRRERMPQQLPYGISAEAVGLRSAAATLLSPVCISPVAPAPRRRKDQLSSSRSELRPCDKSQGGAS